MKSCGIFKVQAVGSAVVIWNATVKSRI